MDAISAPGEAAWRAEGEELSKQHKRHQWLIADWLVGGMDNFSATTVYDTAERLFPQYTRATLQNFVTVARAFPASLRHEALSFEHYRAVMAENFEAGRPEWVEKAVSNGWSSRELRFQIGHVAELAAAAKAEADAQPEAEAPPQETKKATGAPRPAFTLSHLKPTYREKLEKLSVARRLPVDLVAVALLEEALDSVQEEIEVVEERASKQRAVELETQRKLNQAYRQRKAEELDAKYEGGSVAAYLAAAQEYDERLAESSRAGRKFTETVSGCNSPFQYAAWRVLCMEDEAWEENARRIQYADRNEYAIAEAKRLAEKAAGAQIEELQEAVA